MLPVKYTDEQRAEALGLYVDHGAAQAGRMCDIPPRTIRYWANQHALAAARDKNLQDAGVRLVQQHATMREELKVRLLESALDAVDRMTAEHSDYRGKDATRVTWDVAPARDMKDYATTAGILIDKYRLEMGEATGRMETITQVDAELQRIATEFVRDA